MTKTLITAALPSANGEIHIGHLLEYIQADIYSRFLKSQGVEVLYICASDMHGTPVELNAQKVGKKPEPFANFYLKDHQNDFKSYLIQFDNYYKTHSKENQDLAEYFFTELKKKKLIYTKKINVIYCPNDKRTLPDRYVKGTCPNCTTTSQYGDVCESCGSILKGIDLIDPKCVICGKTPQQKESEHYFFALSKCTIKIKKWMASEKGIQHEVKSLLKSWLDKGLEDWCISRDAPYFGFEIPNSQKETGKKKFFYVWLDAPIGYISSTKNYCDKNKCNWQDYWKGNVNHFIGKDIVYFHYLFWPAMLMGVGLKVPTLNTHGFITVNGHKMSKSRGTFFTAKDFIKLYPAESLRFFYASHLDNKLIDIDLNFEDFKAVTNNVLMGSLGNFCYRVLTFAEKNYKKLDKIAKEDKFVKKCVDLQEEIKKNYNGKDFKSAVKNILKIADLGNAYFQKSEPWKDKENSADKVLLCVNLARDLAILTSPILPELSLKVAKSLGEKEYLWDELKKVWVGQVKKPELLVEKIEKIPASSEFPLKMVLGEIISVKNHPDADSLYLLKVSFGKKKKQVVAGLKKHLTPDELVGRIAIFCLNLKHAKIRGEKSEAMIMVADDRRNIGLLELEGGKIGEEVNFAGLHASNKEISFEDFKKLYITVDNSGVIYEGKKLSSKKKDVSVRGVQNGARIY